MTSFIIALSDALDRVARIFIQWALALIVLLVMSEVFARNLLGGSLTWVEEAAITFLGTWMIFIGASHAMKVGMLVNFDYFLDRLGSRVAPIVSAATQVAVFVFLAVIVVYGIKLSALAMSQPSPALRLPMGFAYLGVVVGCSIMIVHGLAGVLSKMAGRARP